MLGTRNRRKSGDESLPDSDSHDLTDGPSGKRVMPDKENGKGQGLQKQSDLQKQSSLQSS